MFTKFKKENFKNMKIVISLLLCIIIHYTSFAQNNLSEELTKEEYLHNSKVNKIAGYSFLGAGVILMITGGIIEKVKQPELFAGFGYEVIGLTSALISIPLFAGSSKNKRKAMLVTLNTQKTAMFKQSVALQYIQPNITFKIKL